MKHCRRYQDLIENYLADDISSTDRSDLDEHCSTCRECAALLALHGDLRELGEDIPMPQQLEFRDMREAVMAATGSVNRKSGFLIELGHLWRAYPAAAGLATAAALICAVFLGRWTPAGGGSIDEDLLRQSDQWQTAQAAGLDASLDSPYSFANVSVRQRAQGQLELSFDACRHVELQVDQDSPLAREVILQAILDPSTMGSRLRAMEVTPQMEDDRLKDALIATMLYDSDVAVRINALAVLVRYPYDRTSQDALLQALGQDQDVQMRLTVLEELGRQKVDPETIREAVGKYDPDRNMAVMHKATASF